MRLLPIERIGSQNVSAFLRPSGNLERSQQQHTARFHVACRCFGSLAAAAVNRRQPKRSNQKRSHIAESSANLSYWPACDGATTWVFQAQIHNERIVGPGSSRE
jgi:hypothetical protein